MSFNAVASSSFGKPLIDDQLSSHTHSIQSLLTKIEKQTKQLSQYYQLLGTDSDNKVLRVSIESIMEHVTSDIKLCETKIGRMKEFNSSNTQVMVSGTQPQKRRDNSIVTFLNKLGSLGREFQFIASQIQDKQRAYLEIARRSFTKASSSHDGEVVQLDTMNGNSDSKRLLDEDPEQQQMQLKLEMNTDFMTETLKDRQEGLNTISKLMHDIHSINVDLNREAHKQDEMLARIDEDTGKAKENTSQALKNLNQAEKKQRSSTKCLCALVMMVLVVIVVIVIVIVA